VHVPQPARKAPCSRCTAITKAGGPCPSPAVGGTKFCIWHGDPEKARIARSRGGSRRAIFDPDKLKKFAPPKTVEDVIAVVGQLAVEVHQCMVDPKTASCIGGLLHALVDAIEIQEQGQLLKELERQAGIQDPASRLHDEATGRFVNAASGSLPT
jgi:hypothetical protein